MTSEPTLSDDRLVRRREHLVREGLLGGLATAGAAAVAVLAVTLTATSGDPGSGPAAFDVQRISSDSIAVRVINTRVDADEMTDQLHALGLNARIEAMPASPQLIGRWLTVSFSGDFPADTEDAVLDQFKDGYLDQIQLPTGFEGWIGFGIGVVPEPGQDVQVSGEPNALAPRGWLGCLHATGGDPATLQHQVETWGYSATWADGMKATPTVVPGPLPGQRVVAAYIRDAAPAQVQLVLDYPGNRRYEPRSRLNYGLLWATRDTNPSPCTPARSPA
jgi:hypothetical protein